MRQTPVDDLDIIGLKENKARKYAQKHGWNMRTILRDNILTQQDGNYKSNRLNVIVEQDSVVDIDGVG